MNFLSILAFGIGLSMDAFAVSVCKGLSMKKIVVWQMIVISVCFGLFQFLMPILGYYLCVQFESYIVTIDHWIAFALLAFIGGKMVLEALKDKKENKDSSEKSENVEFEVKTEKTAEANLKQENNKKFNLKEIIFLSIATSIDALAVGITFAFFDINIFSASAIIGITTFILCCGGVLIGNFFGSKFKTWAEIMGGVILILMGIKILLEHLGVITF